MTQTKRRIVRKDRSSSPPSVENNPTIHQTEITECAKTSIETKNVTDQADLFDFSKWDSELISIQTYLLYILSKSLEITIKHSILSHFFFNLLNLENKMSTQNFSELIQSVSSKNPDHKNTLLISLALSIELQSNRLPEEHDDYIYLVNITKALLENSIFQIGLLKQLMNFDFLGTCGISTRNMFLKSKTRELYTQDRFNLLHEENEGFSKLISIIIDPNNLSVQKLEQITNEIIQIIGFFNLEPNRVLDILLDVYENNLECDVLLSLVRSLFNNQHLKHVIGFKLSSYHNKTTPTSLIVMIVKLMQKKLLIFQDIIYYLGPHSIDDLEHFHDDYETELKRTREYTITIDGTVEKIEPRFEKSYPEFQKDQKFGLLIQLLNFDMVSEALNMLDILSKYDPHWNYDISIACCKSIEKITTPLYEKYITLNNYISITNDDKSTIENYLFPLIYHTKYELYREIKSLTKVIRILKLYMKQSTNYQKIVPILSCILSSLCFVGMNTSIVSEFWTILSLLPYQIRYEVYGFTRQHGYDKQPKMLAQQNYVSRGIRHIFNRISFANVKTKAREILPWAVSNPIIVCEEYIRKCETYDNQIPLCVDVSQFSPEISHDIMQYCLLNRLLSNQSSNIKEDGISIATWLSNLASLYGLFFKTYPFVDMKPVLNYLTQRLKEGLWEHLVILTEIIKNTSTLEYSEEINQYQLEAQAGGKVLHSLAGTFSPNSKNTGLESMKKLKDTILSSGIGVSLVLLLAKLSNYGIHIHEDYQEWKHVADSKDMCHVAYLLLLKFLISEIKFVFEEEALSSELNSSLLIPSVDTLKAYDLATPFIFSIARPTHSSIPPNILQNLLTLDISDKVTTQFYNFFWMKDLSDIYVPTSLYHNTMNEYGNHRSSLAREKDEQTQKYEATMKEFKEICHKFFMDETEFVEMTIILQYCFLPRALFSAADSLYCAKLVHLLHTSETPKFSFNLFLQHLLEYVPGLLLTCTENEAKRLSRLVQFLLSTANRWYESSTEFNRDCKNKPGSFVSVKGYPQLSSSTDDIYTKLDFENYQKFHFLVMENMLNNCILLLKSNDHIKIRIAMLFLSPLVKTNTFPFYSRHCDALLELSDSLKEHHVENIKVLSNTYFPLITSIRKKSENPSFIKPLLKFSVKPTNISIPSREHEIPTNSITPNTAISENELSSLTPQKQEDIVGDFSDSGSISISPPTLPPTNIEPTIATIPENSIHMDEAPTVEDIQMLESSNDTTPQPSDTNMLAVNALKDAPMTDIPQVESNMKPVSLTSVVEETKNTTPVITEEKSQEEVIIIEKSPMEEPRSPEYVPIEQQLENESKSQPQESDTLQENSNPETIQSNQNMMNSKLVQLLKQKQQTKPEDKSEEAKDLVKDIQQLLILPTINPLQTIKTTKNASSERKQANDLKETKSSLQSSRRIDDNQKRDSQPSSQERRLSSNTSSSVNSKEQSQKREAESKSTKSNDDKSDTRYENSRGRNDSRDALRIDNSSQKSDSSRLNRTLDNRNDRNDNRNDRNLDRDSRYSDRYDRRSSSSSSQSSSNRSSLDNRDTRNNDFRRNDSSSNRSDKGTPSGDRRDSRGTSESYQSEKRGSLGGASSSNDNRNDNRNDRNDNRNDNRRGSSSGELKRQYNESSSGNRQSEHESETKKKRFHR